MGDKAGRMPKTGHMAFSFGKRSDEKWKFLFDSGKRPEPKYTVQNAGSLPSVSRTEHRPIVTEASWGATGQPDQESGRWRTATGLREPEKVCFLRAINSMAEYPAHDRGYWFKSNVANQRSIGCGLVNSGQKRWNPLASGNRPENKIEVGGEQLVADWLAIKTEYVAGEISQRKLAEKYRVSQTAISRRAKAEGWAEEKESLHESIRIKTNQKTVEKVSDAESEIAAIKSRTRMLIWAEIERRMGSPPEEMEGADFRRMVQNYCDMSSAEPVDKSGKDDGVLADLIAGLKE